MNRTFLSLTLVIVAASASAQVSTTQQPSDDKTTTRVEVTLSTMDRTVVPFVTDTKQTKIDAGTTRQESVTRVRTSDGGYAELERSTSVTRKTGANTTETSTEVVEKDRQGQSQTTRKISETVTKTPSGEQSRAVEYRRDSSGNMVLSAETTQRSTKNPDGSVSTVRVENEADVNGKLAPKQQIEQTVTTKSAGEKSITRTIKSVGLEGRFTVTAQETETVTTQAGTTRKETVVAKPGRGGMVVAGKVTTTETRSSDGTVQREIVEQGRSLHSTYTGDRDQPLVPNRKIVESEVRKPDGSLHQERNVYRRDVNGDWKPVTFSSDTSAASGEKSNAR